MATTQDLQLVVRMPKAVAPGESVSATLEVVSIKSKAGGSPVEFSIDPIPASVTGASMTHSTHCVYLNEPCCHMHIQKAVLLHFVDSQLPHGPLLETVIVAGLKVDNMKISVPVGERRPLTVTYTAPQLKPGSIAAMGLSETVVRTITGTLKGGIPLPKAAAGQRVLVSVHSALCKSV